MVVQPGLGNPEDRFFLDDASVVTVVRLIDTSISTLKVMKAIKQDYNCCPVNGWVQKKIQQKIGFNFFNVTNKCKENKNTWSR